MKKLQQTPNQLIDSILLVLKGNDIGENSTKKLGEGIAKCVTLTSLTLDLSYDSISENGAK